nr:uncharacterized protein LOC128691600 [Cherax quadricarinatus]
MGRCGVEWWVIRFGLRKKTKRQRGSLDQEPLRRVKEPPLEEDPKKSRIKLSKQDMKWSMMRLQQTGLSTQVMEAWLVTQVVEAVLTSTQHGSYSVIFITDGTTSPSTVFMITDHLRFPGGVGLFEAVINGSHFNLWDEHLSLLFDNVKMLRKLSSHITIVVISDEATFLAAFVKWSVKGRLMVWSTRLLILTHSRLMELQDLHTTLSNLNSMLVIINDDTANIRCSVYVQLPYSPRGSQVVQVASWTPRRGLLLTSHLPLFPEKFSKVVLGLIGLSFSLLSFPWTLLWCVRDSTYSLALSFSVPSIAPDHSTDLQEFSSSFKDAGYYSSIVNDYHEKRMAMNTAVTWVIVRNVLFEAMEHDVVTVFRNYGKIHAAELGVWKDGPWSAEVDKAEEEMDACVMLPVGTEPVQASKRKEDDGCAEQQDGLLEEVLNSFLSEVEGTLGEVGSGCTSETSHDALVPGETLCTNRMVHTVVAEVHREGMEDEEVCVEGGSRKRTAGTSVMDDVLTSGQRYSFVRPPDRVWGVKLNNGSWSGMMGMVVREEVSIGAGPLMVDRWRAEVVDFTVPMVIDYWRIVGVRGLPELNPWGFLFPLALLVWAAILGTLVVLAAAVFLVSSCYIGSDVHNYWFHVTFGYVRILLQQDTTLPIYWLWERVVLMVWMMVTLVLTRSYSGNLMALLAVRHIPQPYQTLRDVMDDPSVKMIWQKDSAPVHYLKEAKSGIYHEIDDSEKIGRLIYLPLTHFPEAIDTLVRRGDHVIIVDHSDVIPALAQDFTQTGKCSFYESKSEFLQTILSMISQKDSPLVPAINKRMTSMTEAGLFFQWLIADEPNSTVCNHVPTKIIVNEALSLSSLWGMFVILLVGHLTSLSVFSLELLIHRIKQI